MVFQTFLKNDLEQGKKQLRLLAPFTLTLHFDFLTKDKGRNMKPKKLCIRCGKKRPKKLKSFFLNPDIHTIEKFCSVRCAASFGLMCADETETEHGYEWCDVCGWYNPAFNNDMSCSCLENYHEG